MRKSRTTVCRRFKSLIFLVLVVAAATRVSGTLDSNTNGMSDVWEQLHNAVGIDPHLDSDGDGFPNILEALAGTDPFNPNSYPKISGLTMSGTNFVMNMPAAPGKLYQLQSCQLTNTPLTWSNETSLLAQPGNTNVTFPAPISLAGKFFRVMISDVESGDGLNDWEKYQLGLDPANPYSNGHLDGNGQAVADYQYVVSMIATQNVVSIAATDPSTVQPDTGQTPTDLGQFTVSRSGFGLNTVTVHLTAGGPGTGFAIPGTDHINNLPSSVTLGPGATSKTISVTPLANTNLQVPVIAQLNLQPDPNYTLGAQTTANVIIYPSITANGAGLTGNYFTNSSTNYLSVTNFNATNLFLTRIDPSNRFCLDEWHLAESQQRPLQRPLDRPNRAAIFRDLLF